MSSVRVNSGTRNGGPGEKRIRRESGALPKTNPSTNTMLVSVAQSGCGSRWGAGAVQITRLFRPRFSNKNWRFRREHADDRIVRFNPCFREIQSVRECPSGEGPAALNDFARARTSGHDQAIGRPR